MTSTIPVHQERLPSLDGVRGIAVLGVMLFHAVIFLPESLPNVFRYGWLGVDVFFALSGFLITRILLEGRGRANYFKSFYFKRLLRIAPLYYAWLLVVWFVLWRIYPPTEVQHSIAPYLGFAQNIVYGFGRRELGPTWSLCVEEHFYLVWPFLVWSLSPRQLKVVLVTLIVATPLARWIAFHYGVDAMDLYNRTCFRLDGLAAGALVAVLRARDGETRQLPWGAVATVGFAIAFATLPWFDREGRGGMAYLFTLPVAMAAALGWLLERPSDSFVVRALASPALTYVGKISYCLYLIHIACVRILISKIALGLWARLGISNQFVVAASSCVLAVCVAGLSWTLFESKILRYKDRVRLGARPAEPEAVPSTAA